MNDQDPSLAGKTESEMLDEYNAFKDEYEVLRTDFVEVEKRALIAESDLQTLREAYKNLGARYEQEHAEVGALRKDVTAWQMHAERAAQGEDAALTRERDLRAAVEDACNVADGAHRPVGEPRGYVPTTRLRAALDANPEPDAGPSARTVAGLRAEVDHLLDANRRLAFERDAWRETAQATPPALTVTREQVQRARLILGSNSMTTENAVRLLRVLRVSVVDATEAASWQERTSGTHGEAFKAFKAFKAAPAPDVDQPSDWYAVRREDQT